MCLSRLVEEHGKGTSCDGRIFPASYLLHEGARRELQAYSFCSQNGAGTGTSFMKSPS